MADTVRPDPFSSVYVLDAHFQYKDGVVNVFNSPAGRAVISNCSPTRMRHPVFPKPAKDVTKLLLDHHNNNHKMKYEEKVLVYEEDESRHNRAHKTQHWEQSAERLTDDVTDEGRNNSGLTRRIVTFKNANNDVGEKTATVDIEDDDARINEKILRLKNHYERGFVADEKCDILKRMLTGFLSGWLFAKSSSGKWRKRKSSDDLYREASMALGIPCEMTDSCRCLDCQCNYFDCGDSDSDTSEVSINLNECDVEEWPCNEEEELPVEKSFDVFYYEDEVKKKTSPSSSPVTDDAKPLVDEERLDQPPEGSAAGASSAAPPSAISQDGDPLAPSLEMAAGTPVLLDHILNTPLSCALQ